MAVVVKPPNPVTWGQKPSVFLAGTIDNGNSVDWQSELEQALSSKDILILNPRRDEWDASWEQSIDNSVFRGQVEWELEGLEKADHHFFYFAGHSQSPITLLEFGLNVNKPNATLVCDKSFWRRGNIEVVANRYSVPLYNSLEEGIAQLLKRLG